MRRLSFAVEFTAFVVVLGIPDGALGVLWPDMRGTFHRALGDLGYVAVAGTVLYLLGGVVYAWLSGRASNGSLIVASCAASAVSAAAWAAAGAWSLLLLAFGAFGLGRGALDAAVNADAAHQIKRLGWLHAGWSVGGAIGPILVAALAGVATWRLPVAVVAGAAAVVTGIAIVTARAARGTVPTTHGSRHPATVPWLGASIVLVTFAFYTAAEIGPISWGYVYLTEHHRLSTGVAAAAVASFWVALTAGRVALAVFGERTRPATVLMSSCLLLTAGLGLLWVGTSSLAFVAMPLAGLGSAAVFPVLVNVTPVVVGTAAADRTVGLAIAAAAIGGPTAVLLEGLAVNDIGVHAVAPAMAGVSLLLIASMSVLVAVVRRAAPTVSAT